MVERTTIRAVLFSTAIAIFAALSGCGEADDTSADAPAPDAEAPYAEPAAPPAHSVSPVVAADGEPETLADIEPVIDKGEPDKVDNITAGDDAGAKAEIKAVAVAGDEALKSEGNADAFNALVGDAQRGKRLFAQCMSCHSVAEGRNGAGPSLYGVVGRQAGTVERFRYSPANTEADFIWTEDALFGFLADPRGYMPGTAMMSPGVVKEQDRVDIIAYLKTLSDKS